MRITTIMIHRIEVEWQPGRTLLHLEQSFATTDDFTLTLAGYVQHNKLDEVRRILDEHRRVVALTAPTEHVNVKRFKSENIPMPGWSVTVYEETAEDVLRQRIAELEKREAQMQADLDEHIQTHLKHPGMCIGIRPAEGGLSVLEDRIILLLEYRFFFADLGRARWWWDYVKPTWPEGAERPGACGWRISVHYSGDETFEERFLPHLKKLVEKVYEDHA